MKPEKLVIRKYGNRRLYDTSASKYVNLDEIAALVRNGTDIQVIDAKSGQDLTRVTLTQVILEEAKHEPGGLPLELLRKLIVATDHAGKEFIMWYLKSAFDAYHNFSDVLQGGLTEVQSFAKSPVDTLKSFVQSKPTRNVDTDELQELRDRIAHLEGRLGKKPRRHPV